MAAHENLGEQFPTPTKHLRSIMKQKSFDPSERGFFEERYQRAVRGSAKSSGVAPSKTDAAQFLMAHYQRAHGMSRGESAEAAYALKKQVR
jgi:hypothetical protein